MPRDSPTESFNGGYPSASETMPPATGEPLLPEVVGATIITLLQTAGQTVVVVVVLRLLGVF